MMERCFCSASVGILESLIRKQNPSSLSLRLISLRLCISAPALKSLRVLSLSMGWIGTLSKFPRISLWWVISGDPKFCLVNSSSTVGIANTDPYDKYQASEDEAYIGAWKAPNALFMSQRAILEKNYIDNCKLKGFDMTKKKKSNHGHMAEVAAGVRGGRGAALPRGRGNAGFLGADFPVAGLPPGFPPGQLNLNHPAMIAPPRGRGGFGLRGRGMAAPLRGRGGFQGLGAGGLFPNLMMNQPPLPPNLHPEPPEDPDEQDEQVIDGADLEDFNQEADQDLDEEEINHNDDDQGADFEFYKRTPISRIVTGKQSHVVSVQQIKTLHYNRGIIVLVLHNRGNLSVLAVSEVRCHLLSARYLDSQSNVDFMAVGMIGNLEIVRSDSSSELLNSYFFSNLLTPGSDPFLIYGNQNFLTNYALVI
jgi:hypothetical protein